MRGRRDGNSGGRRQKTTIPFGGTPDGASTTTYEFGLTYAYRNGREMFYVFYGLSYRP